MGGLPQLLCIEFTGQRLVEVDPCSGASTRVVFDLPGLSNRVPNTSAKRNSPGGESSTYFVQIQVAMAAAAAAGWQGFCASALVWLLIHSSIYLGTLVTAHVNHRPSCRRAPPATRGSSWMWRAVL